MGQSDSHASLSALYCPWALLWLHDSIQTALHSKQNTVTLNTNWTSVSVFALCRRVWRLHTLLLHSWFCWGHFKCCNSSHISGLGTREAVPSPALKGNVPLQCCSKNYKQHRFTLSRSHQSKANQYLLGRNASHHTTHQSRDQVCSLINEYQPNPLLRIHISRPASLSGKQVVIWGRNHFLLECRHSNKRLSCWWTCNYC